MISVDGKLFYSYQEFGQDADFLIAMLCPFKDKFDGVWGPPIGGVFLAGVLCYGLDLPFLSEPKSHRTLIVDDIIDTGKTLGRFYGDNFIVSLFYNPKSPVVPSEYCHLKEGKEWVVFPWAKNDKPKERQT